MQQTDNLAYSPDASLSSALLYAPILVNRPKTHIFYTFFKRLMDVVLAVAALIILSPFFLITAIAIKLDSPGPVFFVHRRIGQKGKSINVYKFRSMVQGAQELTRMFTPDQSAQFLEHFKLENDFRVTKVGRFYTEDEYRRTASACQYSPRQPQFCGASSHCGTGTDEIWIQPKRISQRQARPHGILANKRPQHHKL